MKEKEEKVFNYSVNDGLYTSRKDNSLSEYLLNDLYQEIINSIRYLEVNEEQDLIIHIERKK